MTLRIPLAKHRYATFISTYAPTLASNDETKGHYYAMLRSTLMQVPRKDKLIVLGDFNARSGPDSTIWGNVMGKHGVGNINSNGHRLLRLCSEFDLIVTNTLFQLKHKHKTTWMHPHQDWFDSNDVEIQKLLTSGTLYLPPNSETPTQLYSSADGPCSVRNCKNYCA